VNPGTLELKDMVQQNHKGRAKAMTIVRALYVQPIEIFTSQSCSSL